MSGYIERSEVKIQIRGLGNCSPGKIYQKVSTPIFVLTGNNCPRMKLDTKPYHSDGWADAFLFRELNADLEFLGTPSGVEWNDSLFEEVSPDVKFVLHNTGLTKS